MWDVGHGISNIEKNIKDPHTHGTVCGHVWHSSTVGVEAAHGGLS